jgi:monofunctional glycosyltransferase
MIVIKHLLKTLKIIGIIIISLLLLYSVAFSIAGTIAIVTLYGKIIKPVHEVQYLVNHNPAETIFMKRYRETKKEQGKSETLAHVFISKDSISPNLKHAVIAAEDDGFYTHPGFDLEAILSAYQYNKAHNKNVRGASTITQQLAKNIFLTNEKNFSRKFMELGYTLLMEKHLGKDRILELYLNYAQWGDSIFGCEAASRYYFRKSCSRLTMGEATRLAATLVSPEKLNPLNAKNGFMQRRIEAIANNLFLKHLIDDSAYTQISGKAPPHDSTDDSLNNPENSLIPKPPAPTKFMAKTAFKNVSVKRGHSF